MTYVERLDFPLRLRILILFFFPIMLLPLRKIIIIIITTWGPLHTAQPLVQERYSGMSGKRKTSTSDPVLAREAKTARHISSVNP
ncbi:hypothetical protein I7I53_04731 [Histoplasma capsulatum var. duboisii H88]|uniref:Uncharacterized protein n=1 Tax=Ajellomyces capsulatus (strain H88) TaxID=544711 RepID=A0A8A1LT74_AJEC8|nr:hypothetical protein I7I53_04731 [Histoplasma capsulatum var. duboisii H88]